MARLKAALRNLLDRVEALFEAIFGATANPLRQLGALGWFFFWIVTGSGIYLYIFTDTGVTRAYESIESLTHDQWWAGGILRSLHRYASDALVVVAALHPLREFAHDRLRGARWFAWVTGLLLVVFIYACGITGYWMVWDRLAQYVAQTSTEWLDALPLFAEPLARNFLDPGHLSGRFFTLMAYLHIAAPLLLLLFMWIHIQRHSEARVNPVRSLGVGVLGMLLLLSLLRPAVSQPPADLGSVPALLSLDWFYLAAYPLIDRFGGGIVWSGFAALALVLLLLPWLPPLRRASVAVVHLDNCNGCGRCFADCPFGAIAMVPRTDGAPFAQQAAVDADRCVSCGLCVGACPTATPFRRSTALVPGIELPDLPLAAFRDAVVAAARALGGESRVLVFQCEHGAPVAAVAGSRAVVTVPCTGFLPPSFLDFAVARGLVDGVVLAGCREGACHHRLGARLTEERIAGLRDPRLRERVPRARIELSWQGPTADAARAADLASFEPRGAPPSESHGPIMAAVRHRRSWPVAARWGGQALAYGALAACLGWLSLSPEYRQLAPADALLKLSFSHAAQRQHPCAALTLAEMARLPINMRVRTGCPPERWPVSVELRVDGRVLYFGTHAPAGVHSDGPSTVYRRFAIPAGLHQVTIGLRDTGPGANWNYWTARAVTLKPAQSFVIDFEGPEHGFSFR